MPIESRIHELLNQGKIDSALKICMNHFSNDVTIETKLLLIQVKWNDLRYQETNNLISKQDALNKRNLITSELLEYCGISPQEIITPVIEEGASIQPTSPDIQKKRCSTIYFSYAWSDDANMDREKIIDELYHTLHYEGYVLKRDKMDLGYKGLITEFMEEIGRGEIIIVAITDKYLRSPYCMYELYQIYKNAKMNKKDFLDKLLPIRVENINLKNPSTLNIYFEHWETLEKEWINLVKKRPERIGVENFTDYTKIKQIALHFGDLSAFLMEMNSLTPDLLSKDNFAIVRKAIDDKC